MAFAQTQTKLPLDRWARLIGINPLHFNGLQVRDPTVCSAVWFQYEWQTADRVSREEVARAIATAEADIEDVIGYRLMPAWEIDEWQPAAPVPRPELLRRMSIDTHGFSQAVQSKWGYILSGGVRAKTVLDAAQAIVYSDVDGDGYNETATVTAVVTAGMNPCEIAVFYPVGQGVTDAGDDEYQIRPVAVSVSGVTATIVFRRELCVRADLLERDVIPANDDQFRALDANDNANFLTTVDVYRVYNDPQSQAMFMWEPLSCSSCGGSGCEQCAYTVQTGCLMARSDPRLGMLTYRPAEWNATTALFDSAGWVEGRSPDIIRLWYYAGWRAKNLSCPTVQMDPFYERLVAIYAAALLDRPICECNNTGAYIEQWRRDVALTIGGGENPKISGRDLDCPWGTKRGAIYAYNRVCSDSRTLGRVVVPS